LLAQGVRWKKRSEDIYANYLDRFLSLNLYLSAVVSIISGLIV
jgi:hypothetical protein